jgi:hypothetical protein
MAQNMVTLLVTSLLHFQLKKMFKNMVCILVLLGLATVLATFQKNIGRFFPNHLITLLWGQINNTSLSSQLTNIKH